MIDGRAVKSQIRCLIMYGEIRKSSKFEHGKAMEYFPTGGGGRE